MATSSVPFTLQWWFAGGSIATATNSTYAVLVAGATNAGSYWLVASNIAGASTSTVVSLTVDVPPGAQPDSLQTMTSTPLMFTLTNLLANDVVNGSNPPASPLSLASMAASSSQGGTIAMNVLYGVPLWTNRYNGGAGSSDYAVSAKVDSTGNVYVFGISSEDYATFKYSSAGVPLWTNRYNGPANQRETPRAVAVDSSGNVTVTGYSQNGGGTYDTDYATIRYSSGGVPVWTNRYNGPGNSYDAVESLAVDSNGNVFVTGNTYSSGSSDDCATIKYSNAGVPVWTNLYNGPMNGYDVAKSVVVDSSDNVIVAGSITIKYSNAGVPVWTNAVGSANAVSVDSSGNVFVTGASIGSGSSIDYVTIKSSGAGVPLWTNRYNGPGNAEDTALAEAVDSSGNVFVTGYSYVNGITDYATVAYSSAGVPLWTNRFNGPANGGDTARSVAVDSSGKVFVTGYSFGSSNAAEFATIAYSGAGVPLWTNRYNGPANHVSDAYAVAVDASGNVFVAGVSSGLSYSDYDFATIKYGTQTDPSRLVYTPPPGFIGSDSFTYVLTNTCGLAYTGVATVLKA